MEPPEFHNVAHMVEIRALSNVVVGGGENRRRVVDISLSSTSSEFVDYFMLSPEQEWKMAMLWMSFKFYAQ